MLKATYVNKVFINNDRIISAFLLLISIGFIGFGWELELYTPQGPGPGMVPKLCAIALAVFALIIWFQSPKEESKMSADDIDLRTAMIVFLFAVAYVPALWLMGYPLATFCVVLAVRRVFRPGKWRNDILGSLITAIAAQIVFVEALGLQISSIPLWMVY